MRAFEIHPPKEPAAKPAPPKSPRRRRRWGLVGLFLLLLAVGWWALRPDPQVARARELQKQLFAGPPTADRKAKFEEFRSAVARLSAGQKRELFAPMREKAKADFDRYFSLGPREKQGYLDRVIDRSAKMSAKGPPPPKGPPLNPDQIEERKKKMLDRSTPEDRAKRDQFRRELEARRKQRGLPAGGKGW